MNGVAGKVLIVDLSSGAIDVEAVPESVYRDVLSGVGLGAYFLYRRVPAGADPLGPDNVLGFVSGSLTGTGAVMAGRWLAVCKSPLTGGWGDSNCGGSLSPSIKMCGYDAIFFKGISDKPVYLYADNKGAELRDASAYWGMDTVEAESALIRDAGSKKKPSVAVIGPGGERLSLIAGISNDLGRFAARSGVGAVMGSKRLKAVVLAGTRLPKASDPEGVKELSREYSAKVRASEPPKALRGWVFPILGSLMGSAKSSGPMDGMMSAMLLKKFGTAMNNTLSIHSGDAPIKNWAGSDADYRPRLYRGINPERFTERETRKYHCYSCVVGCGGICSIGDLGEGKFSHTHKPEYETAMAFGGLVMSGDAETVLLVNELLNRGGLDTISVGAAVAFAIECYENGIISKKDTGGLELRWGDRGAIVGLVKMIIAREGLGDVLADGVKKAAERLGKGSERFAVHAGGQELPMHDPKIDPMLGVVYSADPTPGRHTTSSGQYFSASALWENVSWVGPLKRHPKSEDYEPGERAAAENKAMTSYKMLVDCAGVCYYAMIMGTRHYRIFELLNRATGLALSPDEYMEIGARVQTLRQLFNAKQGVDVRAFRMHDRAVGSPPLDKGRNKGITLRVDEMIPLYWAAWGWDRNDGRPTRETFDRLGLGSRLGLEYFDA